MYSENINILKDQLLSSQSLLLEKAQSTNLTLFVDQIKEQNKRFPNTYFYHPELSKESFYQSEDEILNQIEIINKQNYIYSGVRYIQTFNENSIIKEVIEREYNYKIDKGLYWQFYKKDISFVLSEFIYIPIRHKYLTLLDGKVPKLLSWSTENIDYSFPLNKVVYKSNITDWGFYYSVLTNPSQHLFLGSSLYFTGRLTFQDDSLIYEYRDIEGLLGYTNSNYLSRYRPRQLDFPLGMPTEEEIEKDYSLNKEDIYYPSESDIDYLGEYLHLKTNSKYCKEKTFYAYKRKNDTVFFSESIPSNNVIHKLAKIEPSLVIHNSVTISSNQDYIGIKDEPSFLNLNVYDSTVKKSCHNIDFWGEKFLYQLELIKDKNLKQMYYSDRYFAINCYY
jgi:hypothetical protein